MVLADNNLQLPKGLKQCNLRSRPFTPTMDLSIHNTHGIDVWAPKAPRPWSSYGMKSNTLPSSSKFSKSIGSSLNVEHTENGSMFTEEEDRRREIEMERNRILDAQLKHQEQIELQKKAQLVHQQKEAQMFQHQEQLQRQKDEQLRRHQREVFIQTQEQQRYHETELHQRNELMQCQQKEMQHKKEEQVRRQQEETQRQQYEEMQFLNQEQMRRQQEEMQRQREEQMRRQQEEMKRQKEEQLRRQQEEMQRQKEEYIRRQQEEMKHKKEEQMRRQQEEMQRQREEQMRRQQEEMQRQREEQMRRQQEEMKRQKEEQLRRQQEEMQQQREEQMRRQQEEMKRQKEEQLRRQQEEMQRQKEEQIRRQQEEMQRQKEEHMRRQQEDMKRQKEEQMRRQQEEIQRQREEQTRRQQEEMKRQKEEQLRRQQEEMQRQKEEQIRRQQEEMQHQKEAQMRQQQEEMQRQKDEQRRLQQEEIQRQQEEQVRRQHEEGQKLVHCPESEVSKQIQDMNLTSTNTSSSFKSVESNSKTGDQDIPEIKSVELKKAWDGIFGGIAGENNSLVNEELEYEKHSVRNLVAHFSKTKPKKVPLQYLPQQYIQSSDAPPLNYLQEEAKKKTFSYHQLSEYKKDIPEKKSNTCSTSKTSDAKPMSAKLGASFDTQRRNSLRDFFMTSYSEEDSSSSTTKIEVASEDPSSILITNGVQPSPHGTSLRCLSASPTLQQMYKSNNLKPSLPKIYQQPSVPQKAPLPAQKPPPAKKTNENGLSTNVKKPTVAVAPSPVPCTPPSTPILGTTKEQQLQQLEILKKMELQKALELKEQIELQKKQIEIERSIESQKRSLEEQLELKRQFELQRLQFELQKESEMSAQLQIREQQLEIQKQIEILKQNEMKRQAEIQRQIQLQESEKLAMQGGKPEYLKPPTTAFNHLESSSSSSSCSSTESASPMKEYVSETKTYSCSYPATPTPDHSQQMGLNNNNPYPSLERRLQHKLMSTELLTVQVGEAGSPRPHEDLERMVTELASPLPPLEPLPSCLNQPKTNGHF